MAKGEIPQLENGLINFYELAHYFPPNSLEAPFGIFEDRAWKNHHAYFRYKEWNKPEIAPEDRSEEDTIRIDFRGSRYNRLMLQLEDEEALHRAYPLVDPASVDVDVEAASLRDFQVLTDLGVASLGFNMTQDPNLRYSDGFPLGGNPLRRETTTAERLSFYAAQREAALEQLEYLEVTPEDVVTSVIFRYSYHLNDSFLREAAEDRADRETMVYPFDLPGHHALRDFAYGSLTRSLKRELKQAA